MNLKIIMIAVTIIVLVVSGKSQAQKSASQTVTEKKTNKMETSIEKNKAVVRSLIEEVLNKKNTVLLKELIADEYSSARGTSGPAGFMEPIKPLHAAFPDIAWSILDMIGEGDKVMVRWKWQGTHREQFTHYPATGKTFTNDGMALFELKNGKVTGASLMTDRLGFLQQMGSIPEDLSQLPARKN